MYTGHLSNRSPVSKTQQLNAARKHIKVHYVCVFVGCAVYPCMTKFYLQKSFSQSVSETGEEKGRKPKESF